MYVYMTAITWLCRTQMRVALVSREKVQRLDEPELLGGALVPADVSTDPWVVRRLACFVDQGFPYLRASRHNVTLR